MSEPEVLRDVGDIASRLAARCDKAEKAAIEENHRAEKAEVERDYWHDLCVRAAELLRQTEQPLTSGWLDFNSDFRKARYQWLRDMEGK